MEDKITMDAITTSSRENRILLQFVTTLILMVVTTNAKIKGHFQCTIPPLKAITCSTTNLPTVADGSFDCQATSDVSKGQACALTCNDGFYSADDSRAVCEAGTTNGEGKWSNGSFVCSEISCSTINLPTVADGSFDCGRNLSVPSGGECTLTCNNNFYPAEDSRAVCEAGTTSNGEGKWSNGSFVCSEISCSTINLPTVADGSFDCGRNLSVPSGGECTLTCNNNFYPAEDSRAVCEAGTTSNGEGKWSNGSFVCSEISCSTINLPIVPDGFFDCGRNLSVPSGGECTLTCNNNFYPAEDSRAVCEAGTTSNGEGKWSNGSFVCSEISCSTINLPIVPDGFFDCGLNVNVPTGGECTLTCNNNFYPAEDSRAVCEVGTTSNGEGKWSNGSLVCSACNEWTGWNGRKYKLLTTWQKWEESRQLCKVDNSSLVTIVNQEENDFVHKMTVHCGTRLPWIGLSDHDAEGKWEWSDGTVATYRNWAQGEPNGGNNHDCVYIKRSDSKWNDRPCSWRARAICEKEGFSKVQ